ncbi:MAG: HAD hydrolase-like protein [Candidatus Omnitrophica bacterium]|nr:HAD hydrolase-like protein [Candidatus Omnitrophota bacterium]
MQPVDLIVFDLDGTLIDSQEGIAQAMNLALKQVGLPAKSHSEIASYIGN